MLKLIKKSEEPIVLDCLLFSTAVFFCCRIIGFFPVQIQISEIKRHGSTLSSCTYKARVSVSLHKVQLFVLKNCNQKFSCWCHLGMADALDICILGTAHFLENVAGQIKGVCRVYVTCLLIEVMAVWNYFFQNWKWLYCQNRMQSSFSTSCNWGG